MTNITNRLKGTGVAIVTPFRNDDSIDLKSLRKLVNFQVDNKIDYIVVLGTTGESVTLTTDEKRAVIETVIETVDSRVPVVVGVGGNNTQDIIHKIKTCDFTGIDAVLSVSPYYNKPNQRGIIEHYKAISSVCPLPIIIYNVPGRTGSNINAETTLHLAKTVKNIVAVKEASGNLLQVMEIIKNKPANFMVISGDDALTLPILALGGNGVISVVANAFPAEFSEMVNLALNNKYQQARTIHYQLLDLINALFAEGSPAGVKAVLSSKSLIGNNLRLPLVPVSSQLNAKLVELAKAIG